MTLISPPVRASWPSRFGAGGREESVDLPAAGACRLAISPDGRFLAAGLASGRVAVWTVPFDGPEGLKQEASKVVGRNLTKKEWERYFPSEPYRETFDYRLKEG